MVDLVLRGLPTMVFNAVGAMPTDRGPLGKRILRAAARAADLLIGVECDDLDPDDVDDVLDPEVWWHRHRQAEHRDGVLLAGRRKRTRISEVKSIPGAPSSPVNDPRDILKGRITVDDWWDFTAAGLHVPRWREGGEPAALAMVESSREINADLLGGDFNIRRLAMLRRYPQRTVRGVEVMHLVANPNRIEVGPAQAINLLPGTEADDHPGVRAIVRPILKKEHRP
jgi:hypothetical protein